MMGGISTYVHVGHNHIIVTSKTVIETFNNVIDQNGCIDGIWNHYLYIYMIL